MEVKFLGFSVSTTGGKLTHKDAFDYLGAIPSLEEGEDSHKRTFLLNSFDCPKYYKGLVITVKNKDKHCVLNGTTLTISGSNSKSRALDFNFMVINKKTGLGLYQYYHHSCSLTSLNRSLKRFFNIEKTNKIELALNSEKQKLNRELKKSEIIKIKKPFHSTLRITPLVSSTKLDQIMSSCKGVKTFSYELSAIKYDVTTATPLGAFIKRRNEKLTFIKDSSVRGVFNGIKEWVQKNKPSKGNILIEDFDGEEKSINIVDMPECFHKEDYDILVKEVDGLDLGSFYKHMMFTKLIEIVEDDANSHIFVEELDDD